MPHSKLFFGADYNPDQWLDHPEILEQDIELMKKAHVSAVSLGIFAWTALEPEEGHYTLDWMEEIINRLYAAGVSVNLATPTGSRPAWMAQRYPEVRRVNADRTRQLFGERENHCYTSPVYREKVKQIDQALARRFGHHPGVILWHLSNEYCGECHCPLCQEAFREWLRERYGSLDALNKAWNSAFWSHTYTDFSQIESPCPHGENSLHGLKLDWKRFVSHQTIEFMKWERDCIREVAPDAKVCANLMYFFGGIDYFDMAREIDLATWDTYPVWHKPSKTFLDVALDTGFMHDLIYSLKDKPYWLMENCPGATNWQPISKQKKPGTDLFAGLQTIAQGSDAVMYFQWRKSRGASEKFHGAVVAHDGRDDHRVFLECSELGRTLERLSPIAGTMREKQAAIVYDWNNRWAMEDAQGPRNEGLDYNGELLRHYAGLRQNGIQVQMVDERCDLTGYKLVVAPMLYMLREDFAAKLRAFVEQGGTLVTTYWTGVVNESDLCWLGDTPHGLTDVLGLRRMEIDAMYDGETRLCLSSCNALPARMHGRLLCEVAIAQGAEPLAQYAEDYFAGAPAVSVHRFGAGKAYYLATRFEKDFYKPFYAHVCNGLLASFWPHTLPDGVLCSQRGDFLFLQNATDRPLTTGPVSLPPFCTTVLQKRGDDFDCLFQQEPFVWKPV